MKLQVNKFEEFGLGELYVIETEEGLWFDLRNSLRCLNITSENNSDRVKSKLSWCIDMFRVYDEDHCREIPVPFVTEEGFYQIMLEADTEATKKIKDWLAFVVLPGMSAVKKYTKNEVSETERVKFKYIKNSLKRNYTTAYEELKEDLVSIENRLFPHSTENVDIYDEECIKQSEENEKLDEIDHMFLDFEQSLNLSNDQIEEMWNVMYDIMNEDNYDEIMDKEIGDITPIENIINSN